MPWQVYNSAGQLLQATDLPDNAVTNAKVADDAVGVAELSATGTASSSTFLRGDNAWAAAGGGPSQATQSAIEAETNQDTYIPPDLMRYARGIGKAWALWEQAGAHDFLQASPASAYNYTSLADGGGAGDTDHVIAIDFATAFYVTAGMPDSGFIRVGDSKTTGTFTTVTNTPSGTEADAGHNTVVVTGGFVD